MTTIKTMTDKFDALANMVLNLSERVAELADKQEINQNKRNRPPESPLQQPPGTSNTSPHGKSPPAKQQRGVAPAPPATPPPSGYPKAGTREGK
jgi:hypothetical protein